MKVLCMLYLLKDTFGNTVCEVCHMWISGNCILPSTCWFLSEIFRKVTCDGTALSRP